MRRASTRRRSGEGGRCAARWRGEQGGVGGRGAGGGVRPRGEAGEGCTHLPRSWSCAHGWVRQNSCSGARTASSPGSPGPSRAPGAYVKGV